MEFDSGPGWTQGTIYRNNHSRNTSMEQGRMPIHRPSPGFSTRLFGQLARPPSAAHGHGERKTVIRYFKINNILRILTLAKFITPVCGSKFARDNSQSKCDFSPKLLRQICRKLGWAPFGHILFGSKTT